MVARGGETAALQQLADLLDALARGTVDDAALVPAFFEQLEQRPALVLRPQDLKAQVRPVKAGDDRHRVLQLQDADDVAAHLRRRRGGEGGQGGPPRQLLQKVQNFQIARAEILPPLGDAVRLVDREQRDLQLLRERAEAVGQQPLRRDVEDLVSAEARVAVGLAQLLDGHGAVDAAGRDAGVLQGHDLILHERDERRDDERQPRQQQGGQLIAKALAAARRHDAEHIAPGQDRVDKRLLPLPEGRKPKILLQHLHLLHPRTPFRRFSPLYHIRTGLQGKEKVAPLAARGAVSRRLTEGIEGKNLDCSRGKWKSIKRLIDCTGL